MEDQAQGQRRCPPLPASYPEASQGEDHHERKEEPGQDPRWTLERNSDSVQNELLEIRERLTSERAFARISGEGLDDRVGV